jgi:hypothetical protein
LIRKPRQPAAFSGAWRVVAALVCPLEVVTREIDRVFGGGHAVAHPELVVVKLLVT